MVSQGAHNRTITIRFIPDSLTPEAWCPMNLVRANTISSLPLVRPLSLATPWERILSQEHCLSSDLSLLVDRGVAWYPFFPTQKLLNILLLITVIVH